jgi:hypothetical protein
VTTLGRRWRVGVALGVLTFALGAPARAQDGESNDDALEQLRELVPVGEPGDYDITKADAIYGQIAELVGLTTAVADFGSGSRLTGPCGGFAYSYDDDGFLLDAAADLGDASPPIDLIDGGQAFTDDNPFKVDTSGVVLYYGFSPRDGDGPHEHHWTIKTSGVSVDNGGDPNPQGKNRNVGLLDLDEQLPFDFSARVTVKGDMTAQNLEACIGEGHVEFIGGGLLSPIGIAALAVFAGGLVGLLFNARPAKTWKE